MERSEMEGVSPEGGLKSGVSATKLSGRGERLKGTECPYAYVPEMYSDKRF